MARNALDVSGFPSDAELKKMFDAVPILERYKVGDKVLTAAANPVVKRARALAPQSDPVDAKKRSKNQWFNNKGVRINWDIPLFSTIAKVRRKAKRGGGYVVIGPKWPDGNKAYFNTGKGGNKGHLWGYPGRTYMRVVRGRTQFYEAPDNEPRPQIRNWIVQAFDEAKQQVIAVQKQKLKQLMDQIWKDSGRRAA